MEEPGLPLGYPGALDDDDLDEAIDLLVKYLQPHQASANLNPTILLAFLQAGQQEESRRLLNRSIAEAQAARRSATTFAGISLVIAILATVMAVTFGVLDYYGDQSWQEDQIQILTEVRDRLPTR